MINPIYVQELNTLPDEEERQKFQISDLASLTWAMRKLAAIEQKKAEVNQVANQEIEHIEQYRRSELEKLADNEEFFKSMIGEYAGKKRLEDPKFKTEKTPYGTIGFRKQQPKWHYDDEKLLKHLNENQLFEFIRFKEEVNKEEIKKFFQLNDDGKVFDTTGQEVEAIKVDILPEKLTIKAGE